MQSSHPYMRLTIPFGDQVGQRRACGLRWFGLAICLALPLRAGAARADDAGPDPATAAQCQTRRDWLRETLSPGAKVLGREATDTRANAWTPSPLLSFDVAPPVVIGKTIRIAATLHNGSRGPLDVFTVGGGRLKANYGWWGTNPFSAQISAAPTDELETRDFVEVHPHPERRTLAPGATIRYELTICTSHYDVKPGSTVSIDWSYAFFKTPRTGSFAVRL